MEGKMNIEVLEIMIHFDLLISDIERWIEYG